MSELTVSQALRKSKKLKGQLAKLQSRALGSVSYLAAQKPAFNFKACLEEQRATAAELVSLTARIEMTNAASRVDWEGKSISVSQAIRTLNDLKSYIAWLGTLPCRPQEDTSESDIQYVNGQHTTVQIPWKCDLPTANQVALIDEAQAKFDRLNDLVEAFNGRTPIFPV